MIQNDETTNMTQDNLKEKTAKGLLWGMLSNGGMQVLNVVFGIVLANILSPGDYGLIAMLTIFSNIADALQESGFISALINRKNITRLDLCSIFWFNVGVGFVLYLILWFFAPLIADYNGQPVLVPLARYAFVGFFIASFSIVPRAMLMKEMKVRELAISSLLSLLISGIVSIVMALCGMAFWGLATQSIVYVLCGVLFSWYFYRFRPSLQFSLKPIKEMFGFSCKMLITRVFNSVNRYTFETFLGGFYKDYEVGYYSQANKWNTMGSQFIMGMVQGVAQPMFVKMGDDEERLRRAFRKMLRFTCFLSFPLMLGLCLIVPEFIDIALPKWHACIPLMQMLCVGGAFMPVATLYFNLIISRGKSDIYMWNMIVQSLLILFDLFAVQHFDLCWLGLKGISLMVLIYVLILVAWTFVWQFFLKRELRLGFLPALRDILPFLVIAVVTMTATYFAVSGITNIYLSLIAKIAIAVVIYCGLTYLSGAKIMRECLSYLLHRK